MTITINIDNIIMYCSINMLNSEQWYRHIQKNLTYLVHDNNCFNNKESDFKVKLQQECDETVNVVSVSNDLTRNLLSLTPK